MSKRFITDNKNIMPYIPKKLSKVDSTKIREMIKENKNKLDTITIIGSLYLIGSITCRIMSFIW